MAIYKQKYNIGDYVYEPFKPQIPGKVMRFIGKGTTLIKITGAEDLIPPIKHKAKDYVEVKFINGVTKQISMLNLADFNALIADHQKKLNTHTSKLSILSEL